MLIYKIIEWFIKTDKENREYFFLPLVCLGVGLPMFFRGLYFEADRALYAILLALVLGIVFAFAKKNTPFNIGLDTGVVLLTAFYGISSLLAVNKDSAILAFSSYLMLLIVYQAVKYSCKKESTVRILITVTVYAIALTSLISLLTATGVLSYPVAYSSAEIEKWLNGTVQYHNAFGSLVLAAFLALCGVYEKSAKKVLYWINLPVYYILMFGLIMSYSRGAWLVAPVGFVIFLIMGDKDTRLKGLSYLAASGISVFAVMSSFTNAVEAGNKLMGVVWLIIGAVIAIVLSLMIDMAVNGLKDKKYFNVSLLSVCGILVLFVIAVVLFPQMFSFMIPERLITRLEGLNFGTQTVTERFVFYKDALKMGKQSILFGLGGGAWSDMYGMYQSYNYASNQIHSYLFQIFTDTGIVGVIAFLWIVVFLVISAIKIKKSENVTKATGASLFSVCGVLLIHSMIDFNLSIFGVIVVLWAFMAMISSLVPFKAKDISKYVWVVLCVIVFVFAVTDFAGSKAKAKGDAIFEKFYNDEIQGFKVSEEKFLDALSEYEKATSLKPYDAVALSAQARTRMFADKSNLASRELAVAEFEKAEKMAPYSFEVQDNGMLMYAKSGTGLQYALTCLKNQVVLMQKDVPTYLTYIENAYEVLNHYRYEGIMNIAGEVSKEALEVKKLAEENKVELPEETKGYFDLFEVVYNNTLRGTEKE